jgi:hypothetical protein
VPKGSREASIFHLPLIFPHNLPRLLRLILSEEDNTDRRVLAEEVDRLLVHNVNPGHEVVTTLKRDSDSEDARRKEKAV